MTFYVTLVLVSMYYGEYKMGRCKDCKFWGYMWKGCCDKVDHIPTPTKEFEIDYRVLDDSGMSTFLRTGPEFGCVLFEEKANG